MKILLSAAERKGTTIYSICLHQSFYATRVGIELDSKFLAGSADCGGSGTARVAAIAGVSLAGIDDTSMTEPTRNPVILIHASRRQIAKVGISPAGIVEHRIAGVKILRASKPHLGER
jgi:hypothetical protein